MGSMKSVVPRCFCSPASPSKNSATRPTSFAIRYPCSPIACSPAFPTSFPWAEFCWAESGGSPIAVKKWPRPKAKNPTRATIPATAKTGGPDEIQIHLLEGSIDRLVSRRHVCDLRALFLRPRRFHQPQRPVPLGHLDWLRRALRCDAGSRWLHPHGRGSHLQHQALETDRPPNGPHRLPGIRPGLRRSHVRLGPALSHLAPAHHAQSPLGDV